MLHGDRAGLRTLNDLLSHRLARAYVEAEEPGCDILADACAILATETAAELDAAYTKTLAQPKAS